jgi:succinoglycan biosynthesis transport protein ExoP
MEKQLDELKAKMEKSGLALAQFEKDLDVINPEEKTNILSARLLQLNTEYTAAQGERVSKEAAWNAMKSGSLEAAQVSSQGAELAKLNELSTRRASALLWLNRPMVHPPGIPQAASELAEVEKQFESTRKQYRRRIASGVS